MERKKIARRQRVPQGNAVRPNDCWSADFVSDKLADGRSIRILTVVDQFTRECVWLEADRSMNGAKVVTALSMAIAERGAAPRSITLDNGSEFAGRAMHLGVQLCFIRPGAPSKTGSSKALMADCAMSVLNVEWFPTLGEAQRRLALWCEHYNHQRPHSALDDRAPAAFAALHQLSPARSALSEADTTNGNPRQGFAAPATAALDPARRLSEDTYDQGEALSRIARSRDSLLSLWSDFQARQTGSGGP